MTAAEQFIKELCNYNQDNVLVKKLQWRITDCSLLSSTGDMIIKYDSDFGNF
jgi:hypothetical protein